MYVESMSREEKAALLSVLGYLASIDGELSQEEVSFLDVMSGVVGLDASKILTTEGRSLEELIAPIKDPRHQRATVVELVRMAWADSSFTDGEMHVVEQAAKIFKLDDRTLEAIKEWVVNDLEGA
jgi:hypothetical protein